MITGKNRATLSLLKGKDFKGWYDIMRLVDEPTITLYYAKTNPMVKPSAIVYGIIIWSTIRNHDKTPL